jgi:hypothetical protein
VVQDARGAARWIPLALAAVELIPGVPALRVPVPLDLGRRATAFDAALAERGPLLVAPGVDPVFQLYALRSGTPLLQGVSGRAPANVDLLDSMLSNRPWTPDSLGEILELTRAPLVASTDEPWTRQLSASPLLEPDGCFEQFDRQVCLFHPRAVPETARLRLDRDARWEYGLSPAGWPLAQLRATRAGVLDYEALGRCRLRESTGFGALAATRDLIFPGAQILRARFTAGEVIFARESRQGIFRVPGAIRPARTYEVRCN